MGKYLESSNYFVLWEVVTKRGHRELEDTRNGSVDTNVMGFTIDVG